MTTEAMDEIRYLGEVERQIQQARARVTIAKNELIEAIDKLNELQISINEQRVQLLRHRTVAEESR